MGTNQYCANMFCLLFVLVDQIKFMLHLGFFFQINHKTRNSCNVTIVTQSMKIVMYQHPQTFLLAVYLNCLLIFFLILAPVSRSASATATTKPSTTSSPKTDKPPVSKTTRQACHWCRCYQAACQMEDVNQDGRVQCWVMHESPLLSFSLNSLYQPTLLSISLAFQHLDTKMASGKRLALLRQSCQDAQGLDQRLQRLLRSEDKTRRRRADVAVCCVCVQLQRSVQIIMSVSISQKQTWPLGASA